MAQTQKRKVTFGKGVLVVFWGNEWELRKTNYIFVIAKLRASFPYFSFSFSTPGTPYNYTLQVTFTCLFSHPDNTVGKNVLSHITEASVLHATSACISKLYIFATISRFCFSPSKLAFFSTLYPLFATTPLLSIVWCVIRILSLNSVTFN